MSEDQNKKQKVLLVHNYYQIPGGEDTVVANEKRLLEEHGHEVILYTRDNCELNEMGKLRKLLMPFTVIYNPRTARDIKRIIREQAIDVVHVHNTLHLISPSVYYAAVKMKTPVVQTIHNFRMLCPGATFYRDGHICEECVNSGLRCAVKYGCYRGSEMKTLLCVFSFKLHKAMGIYGKINYVALTAFNKEKMLLLNRNKQVISPNRIFVKPNFSFESASKIQDGKREYYLYIGRIEEIKGVDLLLDAFRQMPDKKLKMAGTGIELEKYKMKASPNVQFLGLLDRNALDVQLAGCKAVIVSSQCYETFGMIIAEAYTAHRPVIVGNIGNIAGLVDEGITGMKFTYNDSKSLISAIDSFERMNDMDMGERGYLKYKNEFSPEANYKQLKAIYKVAQGK